MKLQIIQSNQQFDALAHEWDGLVNNIAIPVPFLRYGYLRGWWETLGGGEWLDARLYIVVGRDTDGTLCGIAPLFLAPDEGHGSRLMLLGSIEVSDYLDLITRPEDLSSFTEALVNHLTGPNAPPWDLLDWINIPEASNTLKVLEKIAVKRNWYLKTERYLPSPVIQLPSDWETYLSGINKKQRHEIRRKIRRAESSEMPVRWYFTENPAFLEEDIEAFLTLMAHDPIKAAFLNSTMRSHMKKTVKVAFEEGWLKLAFLEVNDKKAAAYLCFDDGQRIYLYNSGMSLEFRELSVGWVLLGYLIQWAIENHRTAFDFLRGDEDYKYRFGGVDHWVMRVQLRNPIHQTERTADGLSSRSSTG